MMPVSEQRLFTLLFLSISTSFAQNFKDICSLPLQTGNCAEKFSQWYFNEKSSKCEQFDFSGCNGNANRFASEADCLRLCLGEHKGTVVQQHIDTEDHIVDCEAPADHGTSCSNSTGVADVQYRWHFSYPRFRCMPFKFSGCNGNTNNFATEEDCNRRCRPMDGPVCMSGNDGPITGPNCRFTSMCPGTHVCRMGAFYATCCEKAVENDAVCPDGSTIYMSPKSHYYLGESCDDLQCPNGFSCLKGNLYARCCPTLKVVKTDRTPFSEI